MKDAVWPQAFSGVTVGEFINIINEAHGPPRQKFLYEVTVPPLPLPSTQCLHIMFTIYRH